VLSSKSSRPKSRWMRFSKRERRSNYAFRSHCIGWALPQFSRKRLPSLSPPPVILPSTTSSPLVVLPINGEVTVSSQGKIESDQ
jgi:hypothetical protein